MYYYADWIASAGTLLSMYLIARKKWQGWLVGLLNQIAWFYIVIRAGAWGLLPMEVIYVGIAAWALWKWKRQPPTCSRHRMVDEPLPPMGDNRC